jgi:sugar/nucleoside kinase (ribokinase family)
MVDIVFPLSDIDERSIMRGGVISTRSKISPGGLSNVAVDVKQLGLTSAFIGEIGGDYFGELIRSDLNEKGVLHKLSISRKLPTGIVAVLILPNKERFFVVDRGANADLKEEDIDFALCLNSSYLYLSGYSFQDDTTRQTIERVINEASRNKVNIVFNPASPNLSRKYKEEFMDLIKRYIDILILNEREGYELLGCSGEAAIQEFLSYDLQLVAWTRGEEGSIIGTPHETRKFDAYPVHVVDSTGAGDMYAASVIVGLYKGWDIIKIGQYASKNASRVIESLGARI